MATYRTVNGDTVDRICWRHYGRTAGTVEAVLEVNRTLEEYPARLPGGLLVELPDLAVATTTEIRLWD